MTGRDGGADLEPIGNTPVVILVRPQLADNIGAVARAMGNGGLFHLRLVAPRDGWPQPAAWRNASGADRILDELTLHDTVADAVADLHHVFATCPRPRHIIKPVLTARGAATELRSITARGLKTGLLFGPERAGELIMAVRSVLAVLVALPVDWRGRDLPSAGRWARDEMRQRYPQLSELALSALAWKFTYDWR